MYLGKNLEWLIDSGKVSPSELADFIGVKPNTISNYKHEKSTPNYEILGKIIKFLDVSSDDLLYSDLQNKTAPKIAPNTAPNSKNYAENQEVKHKFNEPEEVYNKIPLLTVDAIAGWASGDFAVQDTDIERYVVPEFKGVDFLIRVKGSSMYPKYSSGDIVACQYIKESRFIQWGKVYVLDSTQGALVKRLFKSEDKNCIECRSDNEAYPPFDVPKNEIRAMALVIGVIRLE